METSLTWPQQVLANVVVFIGKPTSVPSERPITLTAGLYRLYCQIRKPEVETWGAQSHGIWDTALKGSAALRVAVARELRHELHSGLGSVTGGLYFDLEKFYDTIDIEVLIDSLL